jgi:hypothetical protein
MLSDLKLNSTKLVVDGVGIPAINWRSPAQVMNLLYNVMNLPVQKKRNSQWSGLHRLTVMRSKNFKCITSPSQSSTTSNCSVI